MDRNKDGKVSIDEYIYAFVVIVIFYLFIDRKKYQRVEEKLLMSFIIKLLKKLKEKLHSNLLFKITMFLLIHKYLLII